ncbi:unnamed protein product [Paramecium octaurelia]|uniref:Uncharacterized protein n=1 Tax=Paramecium octaurelia TaxID=43137 RepID=A0A8S1VCK6_PAROT|nr:unnamed protein product [Paramecium octaurelia]
MISNQEYCTEHPNSQIGGIYIGNQCPKIQRKLCMECILELKIPVEQILTKKEFLKQLLQRSNNLNMQNVLEQNQSKSIVKPFLNQIDLIEREIGLIFQSKRDSIKTISNDLTQGDNKFLNITKDSLNPFECSQEELDFLVNFMDSNIFEQWINQKNHINTAIQKLGLFLEGLTKYLFKASHLVGEIHKHFTLLQNQERKIQLEGVQRFQNRLMKTSFHLITKTNGDKLYQQNGETLKIEKNIVGSKRNDQVLLNIEQMKYLEFQGQYGINGYKYKQWNYLWKGKQVGGGNFNILGQKEGKWIDLCDDFWDNKQIFEEGDYQGDNRIGDWIISQKSQKIGGGAYEMGLKIGKWIELSRGYCDDFQTTQNGEYKNGKKVGQWDILQDNGKEVVGSMMQLAMRQKQESGLILIKDFPGIPKQLTLENIKMGKKWVNGIFGIKALFQISKINRLEVGHMMRLVMSQRQGSGLIQLRNFVMINKQHLRVYINMVRKLVNGKLGIKKKDQINQIQICKNNLYSAVYNNIISGIGFYDNDQKVGKWTDIMNVFTYYSQLIYQGEYKNGKKIGKWQIKYNNEKDIQRLAVDLIMRQKLGSGSMQVRDFVEIAKQLIAEHIQTGIKWVNGKFGTRTQLDIMKRLVVDCMKMNAVVLKMEYGLIQIRILILQNQQLIKVNIKMVKEWVYGWKWILKNRSSLKKLIMIIEHLQNIKEQQFINNLFEGFYD